MAISGFWRSYGIVDVRTVVRNAQLVYWQYTVQKEDFYQIIDNQLQPMLH